MPNGYSWRDGWAFTFPKRLTPKSSEVKTEVISRCNKDGNYLYRGEPCIICLLDKGVK